MAESARLRLPNLAASQAQKHVTVNEAEAILDILVQASVLDFATAPAGGESDGDCYIVIATATDEFTGWEGRIAFLRDGEWFSILPGVGDGEGWRAWVQAESKFYVYDGAGTWAVLPVGDAATISFSPAGGVGATDVQAAIEEVDSEKLAVAGGTVAGLLTAKKIISGSLSIVDNGVGSFAANVGAFPRGYLYLIGNTPSVNADFYVRADGSPSAGVLRQPASVYEATTGVLTGTTGTDGKVTVSGATDGNVYVENRSGGTIGFAYFWIGA